MTAQTPPPNPALEGFSTPGVPQGNAPTSTAVRGEGASTRRVIIMSVTLVVAIVVGTLVGWPIFAARGEDTSQGSADIAAYDAEVLCNYSAASAKKADGKDFDMQEPHIWRLHAVAGLARTVGLSEPTVPALEEAGKGLISATARFGPEARADFVEHLETIHTYCAARADR